MSTRYDVQNKELDTSDFKHFGMTTVYRQFQIQNPSQCGPWVKDSTPILSIDVRHIS